MQQRLLFPSIAFLLLLGCRGESPRRTPSVGGASTPARPSTRPVLGLAPPTPTPDPAYRVGDDVTEPVEVKRVVPVLPEDCKAAVVRGIFIFEATIDEAGNVQGLRTASRPAIEPPCPHLENAYRRALVQWKYRPATVKGTPVPAHLTLTVMPGHR